MKPFPLLCYVTASWHGMTPVHQDSGQIGVSLQDEAGNVHRFVLPVESMEMLAATAWDHVQSDRSRRAVHAGLAGWKDVIPPDPEPTFLDLYTDEAA